MTGLVPTSAACHKCQLPQLRQLVSCAITRCVSMCAHVRESTLRACAGCADLQLDINVVRCVEMQRRRHAWTPHPEQALPPRRRRSRARPPITGKSHGDTACASENVFVRGASDRPIRDVRVRVRTQVRVCMCAGGAHARAPDARAGCARACAYGRGGGGAHARAASPQASDARARSNSAEKSVSAASRGCPARCSTRVSILPAK